MEGGGFGLGGFGDFAEHFAGGGLVKADVLPRAVAELADRLEEAEGAQAGHVDGVDGHFEGELDVTLGPEVIDLAGAGEFEHLVEVGAIGQIAGVELDPGIHGEAIP